MGLHKGKTNNPAGRRTGSKNRITEDFRVKISELVAGNWDQVKKDLETMEPKERVMMFEKLLRYCIAPLSTVTINATIEEMTRLEKRETAALFPFAPPVDAKNQTETI